MENFTKVKPIYEWVTHVLPLVYDDTLSYMELVGKLSKKLNELVENNNNLPDYIANLIQNYITSGDIEKVLANVLANYMLNVQNPPEGLTPASGDGSKDDTEAVQGCIDYASEHNGMCVYFPSGSYLVNSLTLKNKTSLFGFDRYATKLVLKGGATKAMFTGSPDQISISGMTLDGNGDVQVNNVNLVDLSVSSMLLKDCVLTDGYELLKVKASENLQLDNVLLDHAILCGADLSGTGKVQFNNVIFGSVSKTTGEYYITNSCNNSIFDNLCFVGSTPLCISNSGSHCEFSFHNPSGSVEWADHGSYNCFHSATRNRTEEMSGDLETNIYGNLSQNCDGAMSENVGGNKTSVVSGNFSGRSVGTTTYQTDKKATVTAKQSAELNVTGSLTENVTGSRTNKTTGTETRSSGSLTETSGSANLNYTSVTETVTSDKTVKANSEIHIVNGLSERQATNAKDIVTDTVTETYGTRNETETVNKTVTAPKMTETINGTKTENYNNLSETTKNLKTVNATYLNETVTTKTVTATNITETANSNKTDNVSKTMTANWNTFKLNCNNASASLQVDTFPVTGKSKSVDLLNPEIFTLPDVKHYGATGDGNSDDSAAIQKSLDETGVALFPSGTYICNNVKIPSGGKVIGLGNATLKCTAGGGCCFMNKSNGTTGGYDATNNILVCGLDFTSDFPNVTCTLLAFGHATNVTVKNCSFHDLREWHFIEINSCNHSVVDNCFFYNYGYSGYGYTEMLQLDYASAYVVFPFFGPYDNTPTNNVLINNCYFYTNHDLAGGSTSDSLSPSGIGNHTGGNSKINNVTVTNCYFESLATALKFRTCENLTFANNTAQNCVGGLYFNDYCASLNINNNKLYGDSNYANSENNRGFYSLYSSDSRNINITDNVFANFGGHGLTPQGLIINVCGNVIRDCGMHGLYIGYDNYGLLVSSNTIFSNNHLAESANPRYDLYVSFTRNHINKSQAIGDIVISNNKATTCTNVVTTAGDANFNPVIVDQNFFKTTFNKSSNTDVYKYGTNWINFTKS